MNTITNIVVAILVIGGFLAYSDHTNSTQLSNGNGTCHVNTIATDGTPPPGTPQLDPQKLCDAFNQAEKTTACLGDWQPPTQISERELCTQIHQRGCGDPAKDCSQLPDDTPKYYYHH